MGGRRLSHHQSALGDVVDAAAGESGDVAVPWALLERLRSLLRADLVVLEAVDHGRRRSSFTQVCSRRLQVFTTEVEEALSEPFWRVVRQVATGGATRPHGPGPPPDEHEVDDRAPGGLHQHLAEVVGGGDVAPRVLLRTVPDGYGRELRLLCLRRRGRGFGERDDLDLRLLVPHLESAYRRGEVARAAGCVTSRQAMLLELVRDGYTNAQIATRLHVAEGTVRTHLNHIYVRLGVGSRTEAVSRLFGARASAAGGAGPGTGPCAGATTPEPALAPRS